MAVSEKQEDEFLEDLQDLVDDNYEGLRDR